MEQISSTFKNIFSKPASSPIAENIDKATDETLPEVEWTNVFAAVQLINETPDGASQAMKAVKARLKHKSAIVINYALIALDTFVKNCGYDFAVELSHKDNIGFLHKFLLRETLEPENRGKLLEFILDWAEHIENPPGIRRFYHMLAGEGFRFPAAASGFGVPPPNGIVMNQIPQEPPKPSIDRVPTEERKAWVEFDCNVANNSVQMLLEAINFADKSEDISKNEIIQEFYAKCLEIRGRLLKLVGKVAEDDLLALLVKSTTDINNALEQYEQRLLPEEFRMKSTPVASDPNLIDFGNTNLGLAATLGETPAPSGSRFEPYIVGTEERNPFDDTNTPYDPVAGPSLHQFAFESGNSDEAPVVPSEKKLG
ncbi:hypothetical protein HDV05_003227 [Chytridiales sp. JEL 0842]|nr:hypothetical protein HDV05_003227 [Chytridiales sp. JEL 0842]